MRKILAAILLSAVSVSAFSMPVKPLDKKLQKACLQVAPYLEYKEIGIVQAEGTSMHYATDILCPFIIMSDKHRRIVNKEDNTIRFIFETEGVSVQGITFEDLSEMKENVWTLIEIDGFSVSYEDKSQFIANTELVKSRAVHMKSIYGAK